MSISRIILDKWSVAKDGTCPLKVAFSLHQKTAYLPLKVRVLPSQWDAVKCRVVGHPQKSFLNSFLNEQASRIEAAAIRVVSTWSKNSLSAVGLRDAVLDAITEKSAIPQDKLFAARFLSFADCKNKRTRELYLATYKRMAAFEPALKTVRFEEINKQWLSSFDKFLAKTSPSANARAIHMRNIRAVFNDAIDDGVTTWYPFRTFKIRHTETRHRSLSAEQLRSFFAAPVSPTEEYYRDFFKLIFLLIGINVVDLCHLKEVLDGRIEYYRAKTNGLYSVRVEPEALELIEKYRGKNWLLCPLDRVASYRSFAGRLNSSIQEIGGTSYSGRGGVKTIRPMFPFLTTYWARHSWASIAAELDIPKETIAHALGHRSSYSSVTDVYIDFDMRKVDEANRRVIDYVLYGKV